ncbi:type II toxin-antitoxin system RelE/ParE family toxin, partial [candidate division KSB1 bacterium]|nr:type II toxin-antitoxin system RelE/ParE family toxin [candidate division KSB1 bacterium]
EFAQKELEQGILYYELEQHGLGFRFKQEVRNSIDRIIKHPKAWPIERGEVRKCFVHKFPYKILYSIQKYSIVILAVSHQHRKPGYWI